MSKVFATLYVLGEIESISRILVGPSQMLDVQEALEKIDEIVDAFNCLDSVTRLLKDICHSGMTELN